VELSTIKGSGPGGRIVEADVKARVEQEKPVVANPVIPTAASRSVGGKQVGLNSMRKSIGERLRRSLDTAIHLTLTREVEADQLVAALETISEKLGTSIPFDAFFMKFLSLALRERPELNVVADGDALIQIDDVNIGFAVALPQGLVVPVINKVDTISMARIASEILRLSEHARSNRLRSDEVSGGTSTVTNLGAYAVDAFTPILNPPQSSILGVGRILPRPVVKSGLMTIANTCWLSFTFDHRVTDGVPAAQTLGAIARMMNDADFLSTLT
jgi:pyruvate dehydrogenase E2 component (dihydrolipoamide acetyltransferase)